MSVNKTVPGLISLRNMVSFLTLPESIFVAILILAYEGDNFLGIWTYIYNYRGFVNGYATSPILPYTIFMMGVSFTSIFLLLYLSGVRFWRGFLIGIATPLAAVASFEYIWNLLFLVKEGQLSSWFGMGPFWIYSFGFLSITLFVLTGVRYWRFSLGVLISWISFLGLFLVWYFIGYPQSGPNIINSTLFLGNGISVSYILNVATKVLAFIAFSSQVVSWGIRRVRLTQRQETIPYQKIS